MRTATLTFDQMECSADRTLAVVLWVKHAKNLAVCVILLALLNEILRAFIRSLSVSGKLDSLSDEQAAELNTKLREIHQQLAKVLDHNTICLLRRKAMFKWFINQLEERSEDLSDIIENLALSCNSEFRAMIASCVKSVSPAHSAEPVARL
jgi:hypothetical protein